VSQRQKQRTNENRARRLGSGEGISRRGRKAGGGGVPPWAWLVSGAILVAAIAIVVAVVVTRGGSSSTGGASTTTPTVIAQRNSTAKFDPVSQGTWPPNYTNLAGAIAALKLPQAGVATHYHAHISLYLDGNPKKVVIPQDIGIPPTGTVDSPIHTHDTLGIIHIESATKNYTAPLQDVFDIWGVRFDSRCIGGYCGGVQMWVNGKPNTQLGAYVLHEHDAVTIVEGAQPPGFKPDSSYNFAKYGL
jgi:hypothetical protein